MKLGAISTNGRINGNIKLEGLAKWLICDPNVCLPAEQDVSIELPVGLGKTESADAPLIRSFLAKVPKADAAWKFSADKTGAGYALAAESSAANLAQLRKGAEFFALDSGVINHAASQPVSVSGKSTKIALTKSEYASAPSNPLRGVLVLKTTPPQAILVEAPVAGVPVTVAKATTPASTSQSPATETKTPIKSANQLTSGLAVLFALIGGMILNLMPCVFPVLALKVFGFVNQSGQDARKVRLQGLVFGAGVVVSFVALAVLLLVIRAAGQQLGWGFQLQSPIFVGVMALFMFAIGLNLLGVFEVGLAATRLGAVASGGSYGESFVTGILATIVATPCTAPFMGAALGYAFVSATKLEALMVFLAMGIGMALPYVLLASSPKLTAWLPRPGAWMETFKQITAFPMFATVIWLVWVFSLQTGNDGALLLLSAILVLSIGLWAYGRWSAVTHKSSTRWAATFAMVVFAIASVLVTMRGAAQTARAAAPASISANSEEPWQPYSAKKVEELRATNRPIFIDFTAAWCLSCQVNKKLVLNSPEIIQEFADRGVVTIRADWTNEDPEITKALASFGRSGVPLYVVYVPGAANPKVLPEVLTSDIVKDALKDIPRGSAK
jgi:thiol:disulfide interchange protein DsbD